MKKMIARTALVASFVLAAVSLSACDSSNDCAHAAGNNATVTATSAMFPARAGGGGGHSSGHSSEGHSSEGGSESGTTTRGGAGATTGIWPHWFGGSNSNQCEKPAPTSKS